MLSSKYPTSKIQHAGKPDFDNLAKLACDAITQAGYRDVGGRTERIPLVWHDDSQVCDCIVRKWYVARGDAPGMRIIITRLQDPQPSLLEAAGVAGGGDREVDE